MDSWPCLRPVPRHRPTFYDESSWRSHPRVEREIDSSGYVGRIVVIAANIDSVRSSIGSARDRRCLHKWLVVVLSLREYVHRGRAREVVRSEDAKIDLADTPEHPTVQKATLRCEAHRLIAHWRSRDDIDQSPGKTAIVCVEHRRVRAADVRAWSESCRYHLQRICWVNGQI